MKLGGGKYRAVAKANRLSPEINQRVGSRYRPLGSRQYSYNRNRQGCKNPTGSFDDGEIPQGITLVSTRKTYHFKTYIGEFIFRSIKPPLFFGYYLMKHKEQYLKMAEIEKAFLDYFYLHPDIETKPDFNSLRFNREMFFEQMDKKKLMNYLEKFNQKN